MTISKNAGPPWICELERDENDRACYRMRMADLYTAEQLVFVDESACHRTTTMRSQGWSPCGSRARRRDFFVRGDKYALF